jgi:hypothetical protein
VDNEWTLEDQLLPFTDLDDYFTAMYAAACTVESAVDMHRYSDYESNNEREQTTVSISITYLGMLCPRKSC